MTLYHSLPLDENGHVAWPSFAESDVPGDPVLADELTGFRPVAQSRLQEFEDFARTVAALGLS